MEGTKNSKDRHCEYEGYGRDVRAQCQVVDLLIGRLLPCRSPVLDKVLAEVEHEITHQGHIHIRIEGTLQRSASPIVSRDSVPALSPTRRKDGKMSLDGMLGCGCVDKGIWTLWVSKKLGFINSSNIGIGCDTS